jgi:predicted RNA methylase
METRSSFISGPCIQQLFESCSNAGSKAAAQFFTPIDWAEALSIPLPRYRPVVIDLNCGSGNLLLGTSRASTNHRLGCDIDPCESAARAEVVQAYSGQVNGVQRITGDVCKLLPLLKAVDWGGDAFCLNPPWDLHWYRAALGALLESDLPTVRKAMEAWDGRTSKECVDSTVATLCLALDLSSEYGEGFLIANESTLQRLIFADGAPHRSLTAHVWAHLVIKGNPMTGLQDCAHQDGEQFTTGVLYFARSHDSGPPDEGGTLYRPPVVASLKEARLACNELQKHRLELRQGAEIKSYAKTEDTVEKWKAVGEEWERLTKVDRPQWNISLRPDGTVQTNLSLFDTKSSRVTKAEAESLFSLEGRQPMQLVMQRQQRAHLEKAAFGKTWRVDPKLQVAVREAVASYSKARAPLYSLSPIQRLGYLDESDFIACSKDLGGIFKADHAYPLRSSTIAVRRSGEKLNLCGELDSVEWDSSELAFFITDETGQEKVFMEARLRADNIKLSILKPGDKPAKQNHEGWGVEPCAIDFTLQDLTQHFIIPEVSDVARVNPEGYQRNLRILEKIESLCS